MDRTSLLARPSCPRRLVTAGALLGALALAAPALGASTLGRPHGPVMRVIPLGDLPDALALDPGAGRAFVADAATATVSIIDIASAQVLRRVAVGPSGALAPLTLAVNTRAHRLFAANRGDDGAPSVVRVLDSSSGASLATLRVGSEADALAVDERAGHAFVATAGDGGVALLDARTGRLLRAIHVGLAPLALAVDERTARAFVVGAATLPSRDVVGAQASLVGVLDTRTGALLRTVVVGHGAVALAIDERQGRVFVANGGDNTVSVLDARTGVVLGRVAVGWAPAALAVDERQGRVFVANADDGTVSMLDSRDGTLLRTRALFSAATAGGVTMPDALAVDEARARVYVTAWGRVDPVGLPMGNGLLATLDARDGALLRTLMVGVAPGVVAVAGHSGRVVVVDGGGMVVRPASDWLAQGAGELGALGAWLPWLGRLILRAPERDRAPGDLRVIEAANLRGVEPRYGLT